MAWSVVLVACATREGGTPADPATLARAWGEARTVDELVVVETHADVLGTHVRLQQLHEGVPVEGGQAVLHLERDELVRVTDHLVDEVVVGATADLDAAEAARLAGRGERVVSADLRIVRRSGADRLVWRVQLEDLAVPTRPVVEVDAHTGEELRRYENLQAVRDRRTHDAAGGVALPGALARSEGQGPTGDDAVDDAHRFAGATWTWYWREVGRDAWDGAGAPMISTAHWGTQFEGAFWDGDQTVFGDGGYSYTPLSGALDIVAHEFTHGVVEQTAALLYTSESGGVNEAWCDALGATVESSASGRVIDGGTWLVGEDITRPGAGGAMRSMADPTLDGFSIGHYADYLEGMDVHRSSGIANRAFTLAAGHAALDLGEAGELWYLALANELTPDSDFDDARAGTVQVASDLYGPGSAEVAAVELAWDAVGVRDWQLLAEQTGQRALGGQELRFQVVVPPEVDTVQFRTSGGLGDADLYARFGAPPTTSIHDCASATQTSEEHCERQATAGTWHVMVHAYQAFAGLTVITNGALPFVPPVVEICDDGLDDDGDGDEDCADVDCAADAWCSTLAAAAGEGRRFVVETPPGVTRLEFTLAGGQGDADLYVRGGGLPSSTRSDCASNLPGNAESCVIDPATEPSYHLLVQGSAPFSGVARAVSAR